MHGQYTSLVIFEYFVVTIMPLVKIEEKNVQDLNK